MWASLLPRLLAKPCVLRVARFVLAALTITLFILNLRQTAERAGRAAERITTMEKTNAVQRQMLVAAARRPRNRDDLVDRLRGGGF
ncbi:MULTISPECIES: hypothetical protein [unclassified Yoonia]|uniref:hypothetical protein n=1 Tax=unclassified Yoonia TaxID=2629118 RepID=UPI002AFDCF4D|nr:MULTISPECIES: hypothetical protein [unclassified Yoonia]